MVPETAEGFNLDAWAQRWDKEIEQWFKDPNAFWKDHPLFSCYNGSGKCEIKADYLPEPYLGDPCPSKGRHSAVFLNLNPGPPDDLFQAYPCGKYTARVGKVGYRKWAKNNPYNPLTNKDEIETIYEQVHVGGENFWGNRNRWLSDVTGENQPQPPFCLEIFPFHSDRWGYYNEEKAREWITEWVLNRGAFRDK
ncbi:hypothetical protein [Geobacter sp.]|uniref:hypothetical protein n=1 Tax=Geobacter sp. TaxID=46610 RepID=UPI00262A1183|nr:hypothetical protein [Geobacter sp.]